jgi:hypothetical protein
MCGPAVRPLFAAAAALTAACAPHEPWGGPHGVWGERVLVEAAVMPGYWMRVDRDDDAAAVVDVFGPGYGVRAAVGNADQSVGLLVHGAFLEEDDGPEEADVHAFYVDFDVSVPVEPEGRILVRAAAGIGMAHLDSPDADVDTTTGAGNLRLQLEVRPAPAVAVLAGIGGFVFGSAGETEAYGTFLDLGLRVTF